MVIKTGDFDNQRVIDLLRLHLQGMHTDSPAGSVFALDLTGLKHPSINFYTVWEEEELLGCGALSELSPHTGEIKSMRTHPDHLQKGVATQILKHLLNVAYSRNYEKLSLETGSGNAFMPAIMLYEKFGFTKGEAFGNYSATGFNQFFHLELKTALTE